MYALLQSPGNWITLITLSLLEIVLGIDNIIFLSILVTRLPPSQQARARIAGLALAMLTRVALLVCIVWLARLTAPWFYVGRQPVSGRDLILGAGGLFLLVKSVLEIHRTMEEAAGLPRRHAWASFGAVIVQIVLFDVLFSLDSVFTAVGLARPDQLPVMIAAIVISVAAMMWVSASISRFIDRHPTIKVLALSFLILIGVALVAESMQVHIPQGYLYFAMAFAVLVEAINLRLRR